jgi:hypothetical protein
LLAFIRCSLPARSSWLPLHLVDLRHPTALHFSQVVGNKGGNRIGEGTILDMAGEPWRFDLRGYQCAFFSSDGAAVQIGGRAAVNGCSVFAQVDELHALRDDARLAGLGYPAVSNSVLKIDQQAGCNALVSLIHQHGALLQEGPEALKDDIHNGVQQWMTWRD